MALSSSEMTNWNTPDAFFLRPFLTREEFAYWKSRFCSVPSSRSSDPKDSASKTSGHHMTSCVRNATGTPCCDERHQSSIPAVHGLSTNCCSNTRCSEMPCFPENIPLSIETKSETVNAKVSGQCPYSTNTSVKSLEKGYRGNPFFLEHLVPCTSQTDQNGNHLDLSTNYCDTTEGHFVQQEVEPTKLKGRHFVHGGESFAKKPPPFTSSGYQEVESAVLDDSMSVYGVHSEFGPTYSYPAERKSIGTSKHNKFPEEKQKRPYVSDGVNDIQQDQAPIIFVHQNETCNAHQSKRPRINVGRCKGARSKINASSDMRKSREITMPPVKDCEEQSISTTISGDSTSGCKPGRKTFKEGQPTTIDLTENNSGAAFKSRALQAGDQIPNGRNKSPERTNIDEVIKTTKPFQRKLMTNDRTGGCAFDHDSFPRLIGVLSPSAIATVMSNLEK